MTNTAMLKKYIEDSGYKMSFIAKKIGISSYALSLKINNKSEFKGTEMTIISKLLKIDSKTRDRIFFA